MRENGERKIMKTSKNLCIEAIELKARQATVSTHPKAKDYKLEIGKRTLLEKIEADRPVFEEKCLWLKLSK
ncbi:CLUMA_CG012311, isoform A [Clunio marinus]|uniref:CLUMA_CG012311, isoform A n=1 Tax=Clunio marinus TaxID=568069 RepID=A0A1J1IER5_9DIPT|nr:CLUMA_CG012311, isoform A [Clunio marinus]